VKSDHFSPDIQEFFRLLSVYNVQYLIVGGEAVIYYGYARLTGDVDVFYESTRANGAALYQALLEFWDDNIPGLESMEDLLTPGYVIQFGIPPNRLDLINEITGVSFTTAWENRSEETVVINSDTIPIYFIGRRELIANKQAIGRHKDLEDLDYLRD